MKGAIPRKRDKLRSTRSSVWEEDGSGWDGASRGVGVGVGVGGGIRSRGHQYLQARGPELGAGRTERRSLSPRRGCPPEPSGAPDGEIGSGHVTTSSGANLAKHPTAPTVVEASTARKCCKDWRRSSIGAEGRSRRTKGPIGGRCEPLGGVR